MTTLARIQASDLKSNEKLAMLYAEAVTGQQDASLDMSEIRKLKTDCARLIHQRLCAYIDGGGQWTVSLDVLVSYAWPEPCGASGMRDRRLRVKKALADLVLLGGRWLKVRRTST